MDLFNELSNALEPDTTKASIVIMSSLSDAAILNIQGEALEANAKINFAKYIIFQCNGNLNQQIDADKLWHEYEKNKITDISKLL